MSESITFMLDWFRLESSWRNRNGSVVSTPTIATTTKTINVNGIPDGSVIDSVILNVTFNSPLGGANVLTCNGQNMTYNHVNAVDFSSSVTGNGAYDFLFTYQSNGVDSMADGSHYAALVATDISLVVTYTGAEPSDDPDDEGIDNYDYPDSHNICVYAHDDEDFTTNGLGILTPISCEVTEEAGGEYELQVVLPADGDIWKLIECESIIKAPVPVITIDSFQMAGAKYWKVKSNQSGVPVKSKVPTISRVASASGYSAWSSSARYTNGAKVSYNGKAWQYTGTGYPKMVDGQVILIGAITVAPGSAGYWVDITSYNTKTNDGKTLATLGRNELFIMIEEINDSWVRIKTSDGVTGYVEKKYVELYSNDPVVVHGREIRQQCFRVYRIEKDSTTREVTVNARHLSYDYAKTYLGKCEAKAVTAPTAISLIQAAQLTDDNRHVYTDISTATVDVECSWDNGVTAFLNPDTGIVAQMQAKLIRDNEDFFILNDAHTDRGFRVEYGNNLKALSWSTDTSSMVTRVIPHCKDENDDDLLLPEQWVDSELINEYPEVYVEPLAVNCKVGGKGTVEGEEVEHLTAEQCYQIMREEAQKRFTVDHADEPEVDIDVDMIMLGSTVEYAHLADLEVLFMYDTVSIKHPLLNLDIKAHMTGYVYDSILRRYKSITLTNARRRLQTSVAGYDLPDNSIKFEKLSSTAVERLMGVV